MHLPDHGIQEPKCSTLWLHQDGHDHLFFPNLRVPKKDYNITFFNINHGIIN